MDCVFIDGMGLSVMPGVLEELGLRPRQRIDEAMMWRIIECNAAAIAAKSQLRRIMGTLDEGESEALASLEEMLLRVRIGG